MATGMTTYQCPACTGPMHFEGASGKLVCDYCESTYEVAEIEALYAKKEQSSAEAQAEIEKQAAKEAGMGDGWDNADLKTYNCPSCGAELICDATTAATSCPYCDNPTVIPGQFTGGRKPDLVIPFKLDKKAAKQALMQYYHDKKFLPNSFKDQNHIEEIKGVYVPFWLYDCNAEGEARFDAENIRSWREGDYEITETDHFDIFRRGSLSFEHIPADGSSKMPDEHMDAIEPFDYDELKPFSTAYLPGFFADKYDVDAQANTPRIEERAKNSILAALQDSVTGYASVSLTGSNLNITQKQPKYALLPVWMLSTKWNGQNFLFAMNGQTGKLIGDLPVDRKKYWAWFAGISLPLMAILLGFWFGIIM